VHDAVVALRPADDGEDKTCCHLQHVTASGACAEPVEVWKERYLQLESSFVAQATLKKRLLGELDLEVTMPGRNLQKRTKESYDDDLVEALLTPEAWPQHVFALKAEMPLLYELLRSLVTGGYNSGKAALKAGRTWAEAEELRTRQMFEKEMTIANIMAMLQNERSCHNLPFLIAIKSMLQMLHQIPIKQWDSRTELAESKTYRTTAKLIAALVKRGCNQPFEQNPVISLGVYDNCDYWQRVWSLQTTNHSKMLNTINMTEIPLPLSLYPCTDADVLGEVCMMLGSHSSLLTLACSCLQVAYKLVGAGEPFKSLTAQARQQLVEHFHPRNPEVHEQKVDCWEACIEHAQEKGTIPKYERGDPNEVCKKTHFIIMEPILESITSSDVGNEDAILKYCARVGERLRGRGLLPADDEAGPACVVMTGDQQTFQHLCWMKIRDRETHKGLVPQAGEMHVTAHDCHAFWTLWHGKYLEQVCTAADLHPAHQRKGLHDDFTPSCWNDYDSFVWAHAIAASKYLVEVVPQSYLDDPLSLLDEVDNNYTALYFVHFCFDHLFPYVGLRHNGRAMSTAERRRWMMTKYSGLMHLCRATGKTNYHQLCVWQVMIYELLIDEVKQVVDQESTANWRGYAGRWMKLDQLQEKINHAAKSYLHHDFDTERVRPKVLELNVLLPIESTALQLFKRNGERDQSHLDGKPTNEVTADAIHNFLVEKMGSTFQEMCSQNDTNDFSTVACNRWQTRQAVGRHNRRQPHAAQQVPSDVPPWEVVQRATEGWVDWLHEQIDKLERGL
jgi:hypothetical protein